MELYFSTILFFSLIQYLVHLLVLTIQNLSLLVGQEVWVFWYQIFTTYISKLLKMASAIILIFSFGTLFLILLNIPVLFFNSILRLGNCFFINTTKSLAFFDQLWKKLLESRTSCYNKEVPKLFSFILCTVKSRLLTFLL